MRREVRVYADLESLSRAAARDVAAWIRETVARLGRCRVALAGGRTPTRMYELLAQEDGVPWAAVHLFWGDERYVPHHHPESNFRLARTALLERVPVPQENVHPIPTQLEDPEEAARAYEEGLRAAFRSGPPRFDLVLLGMGGDGHVASLFPGSAALLDRKRWVLAVRTRAQPAVRVTLTLPVLNQAARVDLLVAGADKREALHRALHGPRDPMSCPASAVGPEDGTVIWWVDRAAAEGVAPGAVYST